MNVRKDFPLRFVFVRSHGSSVRMWYFYILFILSCVQFHPVANAWSNTATECVRVCVCVSLKREKKCVGRMQFNIKALCCIPGTTYIRIYIWYKHEIDQIMCAAVWLGNCDRIVVFIRSETMWYKLSPVIILVCGVYDVCVSGRARAHLQIVNKNHVEVTPCCVFISNSYVYFGLFGGLVWGEHARSYSPPRAYSETQVE